MHIVQLSQVVSWLCEMLIHFSIVNMPVFENIIDFGGFLLFLSKSVNEAFKDLILWF